MPIDAVETRRHAMIRRYPIRLKALKSQRRARWPIRPRSRLAESRGRVSGDAIHNLTCSQKIRMRPTDSPTVTLTDSKSPALSD
jgi:hypothetical protein